MLGCIVVTLVFLLSTVNETVKVLIRLNKVFLAVLCSLDVELSAFFNNAVNLTVGTVCVIPKV